MSFDYTRPRDTASRLIKRFGKPAVLRQIVNSGTEWAPTQTETDTAITVVDLNERVRDNSGTLVGQTQRTIYVETSAGVTPAKGDKVAVGIDKAAFDALTEAQQNDRLAEVSEPRPLAPGPLVVFWEVDLAT